MEWLFGEKLSDKSLVEQVEQIIEYHYPKDFLEIVFENDGACPEIDEYDTELTEGRVCGYLLSFRKEETNSVWNYISDQSKWLIEGLEWRYVPFADDPFGNFICFDRSNDHVVFWDHETGEIEEAADTFTEFVDSLYESDD